MSLTQTPFNPISNRKIAGTTKFSPRNQCRTSAPNCTMWVSAQTSQQRDWRKSILSPRDKEEQLGLREAVAPPGPTLPNARSQTRRLIYSTASLGSWGSQLEIANKILEDLQVGGNRGWAIVECDFFFVFCIFFVHFVFFRTFCIFLYISYFFVHFVFFHTFRIFFVHFEFFRTFRIFSHIFYFSYFIFFLIFYFFIFRIVWLLGNYLFMMYFLIVLV